MKRKINVGLNITKIACHSMMLIISVCKKKEHRHREMLLCYLDFIQNFSYWLFLVWFWKDVFFLYIDGLLCFLPEQ